MLDITKEREYVLVMESMENEAVIDFANLNTAYTLMMNKTTQSIQDNIRTHMLNKHIDNALESFRTVSSVDINGVSEFFTRLTVSTVSDIDLCIKMRNMNEVEKIKPQYLSKVITDLKMGLDKLFQGTEPEYFKDKFKADSNYTAKIKKEMVKTSITATSKEEILALKDDNALEINSVVIQSKIIPFLKNLPVISKSLSIEVANVEGILAKTSDELNLCIDTVNKYISTANVHIKRIKKIHQFLYIMVKAYMDCATYLTLMTIRKINAVTYNINSVYDLYNTVRTYHPEIGNTLTTESVMEDDLKEMDDIDMYNSITTGTFGELRRYAVNRAARERDSVALLAGRRFDCNLLETIDNDLVNYQYNDTVYTEIIELLGKINNMINDLRVRLISGDGLHQALEDVDFGSSFESKYSDLIAKISEASDYLEDIHDNKEDVMLSIYKELTSTDDNIIKICDEAKAVKNTIDTMITEFENCINMEISNIVAEDVVEFMRDSVLVDFNHLCTIIGRKLVSRVILLSDTLSNLAMEIPEVKELEEVNDDDYMKIQMESAIAIFEAYKENVYNEAVAELKGKLEYLRTGVSMYYEASDLNTARVESMRVFFNSLMSSFKKKVTEMTTRSGEFLTKEKDKLINLDTNGITLNMLPFNGINVDDIPGFIAKATQSVRTLNTSNIYQSDRTAVQKVVFGFLPDNIDAPADDLAARTKTFFMIGTRKNKETAISGQRVSATIKGMIAYCEKYKSLTDKIESNLKEFSNAVDEKAKQLVNSNKATSHTESVNETYLEASENDKQQQQQTGKEQSKTQSGNAVTDKSKQPQKDAVVVNRPMDNNNNNNDPNKKDNNGNKSGTTNNSSYASMISLDARTFTRSTIIALETRYVHYINRLRALISKTKS